LCVSIQQETFPPDQQLQCMSHFFNTQLYVIL